MQNKLVFRLNKGNDFLKNILLLVSGTGLSQLIPLLFSPLLTRLYAPDDFGRLAVFMACSSILAVVATGLYELAIMLPKKDHEALNILGFTVVLSFSFCAFLFLAILMFHYCCQQLVSFPLSTRYMYLLPLGITLTGLFQALSYWLNRKKQYRIMNATKIVQSFVTVVVSVGLGYFGFVFYGMLIGLIAGYAASLVPLFYLLLKRRNLFSRSLMFGLAKKFLNYPKMMMPASLLNTTAGQTPVFMLSRFFTERTVGGYSFAARILTAPVSIVSTAIGQIYFKNLTNRVHEGSVFLMPSLVRTAKVLAAVAVVLFLPFLLFGEWMFKTIFGIQWAASGQYVEILAVAVMIRFVVSPLSTVFHATGNHKALAVWQTLYLCTTVSVFLIFRAFNFVSLLWIYACHEVVLYLIYFLLILKEARNYDSKLAVA